MEIVALREEFQGWYTNKSSREEKVNLNCHPKSIQKSQDFKFYHMRKVIRSNKTSQSQTTRWSYRTELRVQPDQKLLLIGEQEMQFMNTKIEKQLAQVRNIINMFLTSIASIWIIWIIWLLNLISN